VTRRDLDINSCDQPGGFTRRRANDMSDCPKLSLVPITPELQRNYEKFAEIGDKYKTAPERKQAIRSLL